MSKKASPAAIRVLPEGDPESSGEAGVEASQASVLNPLARDVSIVQVDIPSHNALQQQKRS